LIRSAGLKGQDRFLSSVRWWTRCDNGGHINNKHLAREPSGLKKKAELRGKQRGKDPYRLYGKRARDYLLMVQTLKRAALRTAEEGANSLLSPKKQFLTRVVPGN